MQTHARQFSWWSSLLFAFGYLLLCSHAAANITGQVTGSYSIASVAAIKNNLRVSIKIILINNSDSDLSNSNATLSSLPWRHTIASKTPPTVFAAHSRSVLAFDLTIPRQEFESWRKGVRPLLSLEIVSRSPHPSRVSVRLTRNGAIQEE